MPAPPTIDLGSGINTKDTIQKLMEVERQPLLRLGRDNNQYGREIAVWKKLQEHTKDLSEKSRELYSFDNPFYKRVLVSSNPDAIFGTVQNGAQSSTKNIQVEQLASHHEIHSDPLSPEKSLPAGKFSVKMGEEKRDIEFKGGKLNELQAILAEKLKDWIDISEIQTGDKKKVLKIHSRNSGNIGRLEFKDPKGVLIAAKLLSKRRKQVSLNFNSEELSGSGEIRSNQKLLYKVGKEGKSLEIEGGNLIMDLKKVYKVKQGSFLNLRVHAKKALEKTELPTGPQVTQKIEVGPDISVQVGNVNLSGKHIVRKRTVSLMADGGVDLGIPKVPQKITLRYRHKDKKNSYTFRRSFVEGSKNKWKLPLSRLPDGVSIDSISFRSRGKSEIKELYFESPQELNPINESKPPQDAIIKIDGVRVRYPKNTDLKEVLPGAILTLKKTTTIAEKIEIKSDEKKIRKKIKEWVKSYNMMQEYLRANMRAAFNTDIEAPTSPDSPSRRSKDRGGVFATDSTARRLRGQAFATIATAYPIKENGFRLLADIGISTGKIGSRWQDIQEGSLKIEDEKLKDSLGKNIGGVQYLFASDNNEDRRIDNGIAYKMEQAIKPYAQSIQGLLSVRIDLLKDRITSNKERIFRREEVLTRKKENLRHQFGRMEQAVKRNRSMGEYLKRSGPGARSDQKR